MQPKPWRTSKVSSAYKKAGIFLLGIAIVKYLPTILTLLVIGADPSPAPVPVTGTQAQSVPALTEPSWSFQDGGNAYFVGKSTGSVTIVRSVQPTPAPTPNPRPVPPPVPPTPEPPPRPSPQLEKTAWVTLIVDPADPVAAQYRTDPEAREYFDSHRVEFRTYSLPESDIDRLGFRAAVDKIGLPLFVEQDKSGKILDARRVENPDSWILIYTGVNP